MRFKPYPKYKPSGVEWFGDVPEHWTKYRLKYALDKWITDGPHLTPLFTDEGVPFLSVDSIQDGELTFESSRCISMSDHIEFSKKSKPEMDDILMGKAASTGKIARVKVDFEFSIWSPLALIKIKKDSFLPAYIEYCLKSPESQFEIDGLCTSNTQKNISMEDIPKLNICAASLNEQLFVVKFLDRETAKIDTLIAKQEKLIGLLKEKRQSVISHAVTKGLNLNVEMKDSGIEWLGDVPEHWCVVGLTKYLESLIDYRGKTPIKTDEGVFLITAKNVRNGVIDYEASQEYIAVSEYEDVMRRGSVTIGDVLFTTEAPLGQVANIDRTDIALAQRIIKFCGQQNVIDNYFLKYWIMGSFCQADLEQLATGSTALGIKGSKIGMVRLCLPPFIEQEGIVSFLDNQTLKIDTLIAKAEQAIVLQKEHRTALISAAVTGKIDVREAA